MIYSLVKAEALEIEACNMLDEIKNLYRAGFGIVTLSQLQAAERLAKAAARRVNQTLATMNGAN